MILPARLSTLAVAALLACGLSGAGMRMAGAGEPSQVVRPSAGYVIPNLWDPRHRLERPGLGGLGTVRFVASVDAPPLGFLGRWQTPTGFAVELARALCAELGLTCTIQARSADLLLAALDERQADVALAGPVVTPALRAGYDVSDLYLTRPARFAARHTNTPPVPDAARISGRRIGVEDHSAHASYLRAFFASADIRPYTSLTAARAALAAGDLDLLFADAQALAMWFHEEGAGGCCGFVGGPYIDSAFFGEGHGLVIRRGNPRLRRAFDYGIQRLYENGTYAELYLRWFPVSLY